MKFTTSLTSNDPLAEAAKAVLEAKFGPQSPANKLAQLKSFVEQYQISLKHAIADQKDAETISFWKKRLAEATKELTALTKNEETLAEASGLSEAAAQKIARELYSKHKNDAHHLGNLLIQLAINKGKFNSEKKQKKPASWAGYIEPGRDRRPTTGW